MTASALTSPLTQSKGSPRSPFVQMCFDFKVAWLMIYLLTAKGVLQLQHCLRCTAFAALALDGSNNISWRCALSYQPETEGHWKYLVMVPTNWTIMIWQLSCALEDRLLPGVRTTLSNSTFYNINSLGKSFFGDYGFFSVFCFCVLVLV